MDQQTSGTSGQGQRTTLKLKGLPVPRFPDVPTPDGPRSTEGSARPGHPLHPTPGSGHAAEHESVLKQGVLDAVSPVPGSSSDPHNTNRAHHEIHSALVPLERAEQGIHTLHHLPHFAELAKESPALAGLLEKLGTSLPGISTQSLEGAVHLALSAPEAAGTLFKAALEHPEVARVLSGSLGEMAKASGNLAAQLLTDNPAMDARLAASIAGKSVMRAMGDALPVLGNVLASFGTAQAAMDTLDPNLSAKTAALEWGANALEWGASLAADTGVGMAGSFAAATASAMVYAKAEVAKEHDLEAAHGSNAAE